MKLLFTAGGSQATIYSVAPLATAARNAGHEILLAVDEQLIEAAEAIGIPAVPTPHPRMATARLDALVDLATDWPPDVVIGGLSRLPGILAAYLKVPYVRQSWEISPVRDENLGPELERLGLAGLPDPDLVIDVCPPCLRPSPTPGAQPMRWIPRNRQRRLERWMYTRPEGRPRVLVTSGTRSLMLSTPGSSMRHLVDQLAVMGAEVLIAAPDAAAREFAAELGDIHIGWIPLDVVAPTCDLAIHHGGAATTMTIMTAGVPHLIIPDNGYSEVIALAVSGFGAAIAVIPEQHGPDADLGGVIVSGCREILASPLYLQQARDLAREITELPAPSELVCTLEALAAGLT